MHDVVTRFAQTLQIVDIPLLARIDLNRNDVMYTLDRRFSPVSQASLAKELVAPLGTFREFTPSIPRVVHHITPNRLPISPAIQPCVNYTDASAALNCTTNDAPTTRIFSSALIFCAVFSKDPRFLPINAALYPAFSTPATATDASRTHTAP